MDIYYFSGTGNSLFVTKELQKRIPDAKLIPIVKHLKDNNIKAGENVGFVFPIYFTAIPMPVKNFIEKMDLSGANYIFAIATRIGTQQSAFYTIEKILKKKGLTLNACFSVKMPGNDPKFGYKTPTAEEIKKIEAGAIAKFGFIEPIVARRQNYKEKDTEYNMRVPFVNFLSLIVPLMARFQPKYYSDDRCDGCAACAKVCLSGKIRMIGKKPQWRKEIRCFNCDACINFCPKQSVQIKGHTEKNGRYNHPYAKEEDIVAQK